LKGIRISGVKDDAVVLIEALRDGDWLDHWNDVWIALSQPGVPERLIEHGLRARVSERLAEALIALNGNWGGGQSWYLSDTISKCFNSRKDRLELLELAIAGGAHIRDIGSLLGPLARSETDLPQLASTLSRWLIKGWISGMNAISNLVETALIGDAEDGRLAQHALTLGRRLSAAASLNERIVGIALMSELRQDPEACVEVAEACVAGDQQLAEAANHVVWKFCRTRGVYRAPVGEPPPALREIASMLALAQCKCRTPAARALLSQMRRRIDDDLEQHARHDEALRDPHFC
jgi:hypothetical protein